MVVTGYVASLSVLPGYPSAEQIDPFDPTARVPTRILAAERPATTAAPSLQSEDNTSATDTDAVAAVADILSSLEITLTIDARKRRLDVAPTPAMARPPAFDFDTRKDYPAVTSTPDEGSIDGVLPRSAGGS